MLRLKRDARTISKYIYLIVFLVEMSIPYCVQKVGRKTIGNVGGIDMRDDITFSEKQGMINCRTRCKENLLVLIMRLPFF